MNANGARFDLVLGRADWGRCTVPGGADRQTLAALWQDAPLGATAALSPGLARDVPAWDGRRHEVTLQPLAIALAATTGEAPLILSARRGAAADRHGNVYRIADDARSLRVFSVGSRDDAVFWPAEPADCASVRAAERLAFAPTVPSARAASPRYLALAVTADDYLVVAFERATGGDGEGEGSNSQSTGAIQRGLLCFDLLAGGEPVSSAWPQALVDASGLAPFDICARAGGGVWLLERSVASSAAAAGPVPARLWELDCNLAVVTTAQPLVTLAAAEVDDFQPLSGAPRQRAARQFAGGIDLAAWAVDPIAVVGLGAHAVLLLDRDTAAQRSRVLRLWRDRGAAAPWRCDASPWFSAHELGGLAHDMVLATAQQMHGESAQRLLFITSTAGNQARAFHIGADGDEGGAPGGDAYGDADGNGAAADRGHPCRDAVAAHDLTAQFTLTASPALFPLRRHGGRALIVVRGQACYDSGLAQPTWTPIVQQPRPRFAPRAEFITPVFDSGELGTTWDRLLIDGCVPPGTRIDVFSCAGDASDSAIKPTTSSASSAPGTVSGAAPAVLGSWQAEPQLRLRREGPELPWLRQEAIPATRTDTGTGTWELLLQRAHGRYLQLRIVLGSDTGTASPRLRALRVWSPRFSWSQRFLPAVYREDASAGPFLERWLANLESTMTALEDRIVNVRALFDPRSAPAETLAWLAEWFDVALDPAWDERRRRLFVQRAIDFFRWRGTVHGLRLALELAFDPCIDARRFDGPSEGDDGARRIRIVEAYQARVLGAVVAGDPGGSAPGPRLVRPEARWRPEEGNAGLVARWARAQGRAAEATELLRPFALTAPAAAQARAQWRAFCDATLGFVPEAGAAEQARWQAYRVARKLGQIGAGGGTGGGTGVVEATRAAETAATAGTTQPAQPAQPAAAATANESAAAQSATNAATAAADASAKSALDALATAPLPRDWPTTAKERAAWQAFVQRADGLWMRTRWQQFLASRYRRIEQLNAAWQTRWPAFELVALPDLLPDSAAAQIDWLQFEGQLLAIDGSAHRFSVLLPVADVTADPAQLDERLALARRIVELEKPAHTVFDVRFYWAFNRVGEARLGLDTQLGAGSRAPELIPSAVLGRAYVGASFIGASLVGASVVEQAPLAAGDRLRIAC